MGQPKRKAKKDKEEVPSVRRSVTQPDKFVIQADKEFITAGEAAKIAKVPRQTIHKWCTKFGIGKQVGRYFRIYPDRLKDFLEKDKRPRGTSPKSQKRILTCPYGYHFGIDFDEREKCENCNQIVWLNCNKRSEQIYFAKQSLSKNKMYTDKELDKKIKEMEERI